LRRLQQLTVYIQSAPARGLDSLPRTPAFPMDGFARCGSRTSVPEDGPVLDPVRKKPWFQAIERDLRYAD